MDNLLLIFACLTLGYFFKYIPTFNRQAYQGINTYIIWVALPALALLYIPKLVFTMDLLWLALMAWVVFGVSILFFNVSNIFFKWDKATIGCLVLTCGLCNTSFVGFPLLEFLYGSNEPLYYAIVCDQAGSFLVVATVAVLVAMHYSGKSTHAKGLLKKLGSFPPFIAFLVAIFLLSIGGLDVVIEDTLKKLASPLIPLALFSIGMQIEFSTEGLKWSALSVGLMFKLALAPFLIWILYLTVFTQKNMAFEVGILEAAMPPMVTGVLLTQEYQLNPKLGSLVLAIGIPLSMITVWIWYACVLNGSF